MITDYPEEWNELSKYERKKKIKELLQEQERKSSSLKKIRNIGLIVIAIILIVVGIIQLTKKTPEQIKLKKQVATVSLDGKVEKFAIEGRDHVSTETSVEYKTNPPTSGSHLDQAKNWGIYSKEIDDKAGVHGLEHGGIWISYKDIDDVTKKELEEIGKDNSLSVIVSPRIENDNKIVVASWGRMMRLETLDKVLIQKYIDTYKNQSPEKLAR